MKFKNGVYPEIFVYKNGKRKRLKYSDEVQYAMDVLDSLSNAISGKEAITTAIFDGSHMTGSKHYSGDAFDFRKWIYTDGQLQTIIANLRDNLGPDYDVVVEKTHIHVEYDPKGPKKKVKDEGEIKRNMGVSEREENNYWNVANAISTGHAGFLTGSINAGANSIHPNNRGSDRGHWRHPQGSKNRNNEKLRKNKTQREVESRVDIWLKLNISINRIIKFLKLVSWKNWETKRG